ncbi:MAG: MHYT domain-containing protein, partial [Alphaproteobacteria bacterium]
MFKGFFLDTTGREWILDLCLPHRHDGPLTALAVGVALFACYAAFHIAERIAEAASPAVRAGWAVVGAATLGGGAWATHFIALLALRLPDSVYFDPWTTVSSLGAGFGAGA